jgi:sortase A
VVGFGYTYVHKVMKTISPIHNPLFPSDEDKKSADQNPAADLIRQQIGNIYKEPDAQEELSEAETAKHRSKHQQFMHELNNSGKSLADIQTAWHEYYVSLPNHEKHQVWQEFYANHSRASKYVQKTQPQQTVQQHSKATHHKPAAISQVQRVAEQLSVGDIKQQLLSRVQGRAKVKRSPHTQSLIFGLSMGAIVAFVFLFGFFNERFLVPFMTPSRQVSNTPIIIDPSSTDVGPESKIIIPKINVEIPVVYDEPSIDEGAVQRALERGVLHYPTTPNPGELGNGVIFGHSSNNILNKGKYKFAFVSLKRMEVGDTFMIHKDGKRYVYKVFDKKIVKPEDVSVLGHAGKTATMTLITCDPPGTSLMRLVVVAEQITPDPHGNVASKTAPQEPTQPEVLPSNAPTLWSRLYAILTR